MDYQSVCKKFQAAVAVKYIPICKINSEKSCITEDLKKKLEDFNQESNRKTGQDVLFTPIGVCEIGHCTGNKFLWELVNICNNRNCNQRGNTIVLNLNKASKWFLIFLKCSVLIYDLSSEEDLQNDYTHKHMFVKLFNNQSVEKHRQEPDLQNFFEESLIKKFRSEARSWYPKFLSSKLSDFPPHPYQNAFIGLLAKCAYRMSDLDPLRHSNPTTSSNWSTSDEESFENFKLLPFAACIKLAFDVDKCGKVAKLLGEIGHRPSKEKLYEKRRESSVKTAKEIIDS